MKAKTPSGPLTVLARSLCVLSVLLLLCTAWAPGEAKAQALTTDHQRDPLLALNTHAKALPALQRIVTIDIGEATLASVLREIAREGGFGLAYSPDLIPEERIISVRIGRSSIAEALRAIAEHTDLKVFISPHKEIVLVKASQPGAISMISAAPLSAYAKLIPAKVQVQGLAPLQLRRPIITGTVTDAETGEPLPDVNVIVAGTQMGTATDADGTYSLEVSDDAEALVFTYIGYEPKRVPIDGRSAIDVQLSPIVTKLEGVVVVGYGAQQRAEVTGAIASVQAEDLQGIPVASFQKAIQGQIAGVRVKVPSGAPGAAPRVTVRGTGSISAGSSPLYVIDGLPISNSQGLQGPLFRRRPAFQPPKSNPLASLNPNDIASIEVLKDASAAAIYGSRGSNGVVLIETKKGDRVGGPTIEFNSYVGVQQVTNVPDMMEAKELIAYTEDSRNNNYVQKYHPEQRTIPDPEGAGQILNPYYNPGWNPHTNEGRPDDAFVLIPEKYVNWDGQNTNWLDLVFSPAPMSSTNLSIAGGTTDIGYYLSGGYFNQQGVLDGSAYQRYTLRANLTADPLEQLQVGANLQIAFTRQDRLPASAPYFARPPGIVYSAMVHSPVIEPYGEAGPTPYNQLDGQSYLGGGTTSASHPLAIMNDIDEDLDAHRTFGNIYAEYEIADGLAFRTSFGVDLIDYTRSFYRGNDLLYRTSRIAQSYAQASSARSFNWVIENTLTYDAAFGEHDVSVLAGFTAQAERNDYSQTIARNFPNDAVQTLNAGQIVGGYSVAQEWSLLSYLARVNYSYLDRYLLTATLRADQSSRFSENNRTGIFPSVSAGWRISEEPFMDGLEYLSNLKVRASYGVTGNFLIPNYGWYSLLSKSSYNFGGEVVTAAVPVSLGDDDLTWETTRQFNLGLDVGLFEDRVSLTANYYYGITSDLLLNVTLPAVVGYTTVLTNIGEVENEGLELALSTRNLVGTFNWTTDLTFATNRNEVLELGPFGDPIISGGIAGIRHITRIGSPVGSFYGYVVDGVYQTMEDIRNAPEDLLAPAPRPGDFRFKDVNGDGVVDENDRTVIGNAYPDFTFGITNTFGYKNFNLRVFVQGVQGQEILNLTARHMKNGEANFNSYAILTERWTGPGTSNTIPRADRQTGIHGNNNRPSSYQVSDASYVRLRNVSLSYQLPSSLLGDVMEEARVYVSGRNLAMFTPYIGFNPEANLTTNPLTPGVDYGAYPLSTAYTVGVNLTF